MLLYINKYLIYTDNLGYCLSTKNKIEVYLTEIILFIFEQNHKIILKL